jgi:hypothetical protein
LKHEFLIEQLHNLSQTLGFTSPHNLISATVHFSVNHSVLANRHQSGLKSALPFSLASKFGTDILAVLKISINFGRVHKIAKSYY